MKNSHKNKRLREMKPRSPEREAELARIEREAIANFRGSIDHLEASLGVLRLGDHLGWRALVLIHNKRTIRRFEEILGITIREFFPEEGSQSERSIGYRIAKSLDNFWKAVSGDVKVDNRREIDV